MKSNANHCYWFYVIEMEMLLFSFVKSLRSSNFQGFLCSLKAIVLWMFVFDHIHYARWLPVFIQDLEQLDPETKSYFERGFFTIKKSSHTFSSIGIDQAHEQNNKLVKIHGGAIGIFENPSALLRWSVSAPIIGELLHSSDAPGSFKKHHENTDSFELRFRKDVKALYSAILEMGNPFKETQNDLVQLSTKAVMDPQVSNSVFPIKQIGLSQYNDFVTRRLKTDQLSLYSVIKKNKILLFKQNNLSVSSKSKQKLGNIIADRKLFSRLFIACQTRKGDLDDFFSRENHSYPVSISDYGKLRKCSAKSDFLTCLYELLPPTAEPPRTEMKVIDAAAFVNMNPPISSKDFSEYCKEVEHKVTSLGKEQIERIDLVFDIYKQDSLKSQTRENRGKGARTVVKGNTPIPKDFHSFLRNDENKNELFQMIANHLTNVEGNLVIISTKMEHVVSNSAGGLADLEPCNREEADTRLIVHVIDGVRKGKRKITITTVDTDVVVISLYHFFSLEIEQLWIEFGVGKNKK